MKHTFGTLSILLFSSFCFGQSIAKPVGIRVGDRYQCTSNATVNGVKTHLDTQVCEAELMVNCCSYLGCGSCRYEYNAGLNCDMQKGQIRIRSNKFLRDEELAARTTFHEGNVSFYNLGRAETALNVEYNDIVEDSSTFETPVSDKRAYTEVKVSSIGSSFSAIFKGTFHNAFDETAFTDLTLSCEKL